MERGRGRRRDVPVLEVEEEEEDDDDEEEGAEQWVGEEDEEDEGDDTESVLARSVVQVRTLHRVPNFMRPWEEGHDVESTSSAFVVEVEVEVPHVPGDAAAAAGGAAGAAGRGGSGAGRARRQRGGRQRAAADAAGAGEAVPAKVELRREKQLLLLTTAGAVEHARKVEVSRPTYGGPPYPATVAAVCLDLDVALLRVEQPAFWDPEPEEGEGEEEEGEGEGEEEGRGGAAGEGGRRAGGRLWALGRGRAGAHGRSGAARAAAGAGAGEEEEEEEDEGEDEDAGRDGEGEEESEEEDEGGQGSAALVPLELAEELPHLRESLVVAGYPLGGDSLCYTSGVVSRIEVLEYSHSGRALLALQVDAPLNNGGWGGPALSAVSGRVVGVAFQKFSAQTWMERYDDVESLFGGGDDGDDDDGGGEGEEPGGGEGGGGGGQEYGGEDSENIGYLVPSQLLRLVLEDYCSAVSAAARAAVAAAAAAAPAAAAAAAAPAPQQAAGPAHSLRRRRGAVLTQAAAPSAAAAAAPAAAATHGSAAAPPAPPLYLDGRPRLGLRYQRMESPALRAAFGLPSPGASHAPPAAPHTAQQGAQRPHGEGLAAEGLAPAPRSLERCGVLLTGVDPSGSAAGVLRLHDVLVGVGGRPVAQDATTPLRPGERVLFGHWAAVGRVGEELLATVIRDGKLLELGIRLRDAGAPFLPVSLGPGRRPQYLVVGPLVFVAFSVPLWYQLLSDLASAPASGQTRAARAALHSALVPVVAALEWGLPEGDEAEEVVLLTEVLDCGELSGDGEAEGDPRGARGAAGGQQQEAGSSSSRSSRAAPGGAAAGRRAARGRSQEAGAAGAAAAASSGGAGGASGGGEAGAGVGVGVGTEAAAWAAELSGGPRRVCSINGTKVRNLAQLAAAVLAAAPLAGAAAAAPEAAAPPAAGGGPPAPVRDGLLRVLLHRGAPTTPTPYTAAGRGGSAGSDVSSGDGGDGGGAAGGGGGVGPGRGTVVALDASRLAADTRAVLQHHSISAAMSAELRRSLGTSWPFDGRQPQGGGRQRRQQGRRVALAGR